MPIENEYIGQTEMEPDGYLRKPRYRITCRCLRCGNTYSKVVARLTDDNPPCPKKKCKAAVVAEEHATMERNLRAMIAAERGPGHIGDNVTVKAIDKTADIVMTDHNMTNLKDNIRQGEAMAPPLPPKMQQAADNFFKGPQMSPDQQSRRSKQAELLGRRAMRGAFRGMAVNPGALIPGTKGSPALHRVGTEKLKQ